MKNIAVIDDSPEIREALTEVLSMAVDFQLGAVAASAEEFLLQLSGYPKLDVALVDLGLPGMSGAELIGEIGRQRPELACVAYTVYEDANSVFAALRAGAVGYLVKGESAVRLLSSLRCLDDGGAPLTPRVARMMLSEFQRETPCPLSVRELQVLSALAGGQTYKETASSLVISGHTVHTHVKNIYEKLQVDGRREAVDKARRHGWLDSGE